MSLRKLPLSAASCCARAPTNVSNAPAIASATYSSQRHRSAFLRTSLPIDAAIWYFLASRGRESQVDVPTRVAYAIAISSILQALLYAPGLDQLILGRYCPSPGYRSPVNSPFWPNLRCAPLEGPLFSPWGKEIALQEATMVAQQTSPRSLKSITGAILLALGFLSLFANLDVVAGQISSAVGTSAEPAQGILPALVLATLH